MSEHPPGTTHGMHHQQTMNDGALVSLQSARPHLQRAASADAVLGSNNNTLEWKVRRPSFPNHNEYNRRHHWAQILAKGEEIVRHATDAHKRDFTLEEMQRVESLALSILTEVRKLLHEEHMAHEALAQTSPFIHTNIVPQMAMPPALPAENKPKEAATSPTSGPRKKRGRPPIKKPLFCAECGTTETPEWRRGEGGPNTLCNGCGLRYAKRRKQENDSKKKHSIDVILNEKRAREQAAKGASTNSDTSATQPSTSAMPIATGTLGPYSMQPIQYTTTPTVHPEMAAQHMVPKSFTQMLTESDEDNGLHQQRQ